MKRAVIAFAVLVAAIIGMAIISEQHPGGDDVGGAEKLDLTQARPLAPDFQLDGLNRSALKLSDMRGKVVILNFWATWCPPCREEIPSMNRLQTLVGDMNMPVEIVAVNIESDGPRTVPQFVQKQPLDFTVLYDVTGSVHNSYGVSKYPETFIIDTSGVVVNKVIGGTDWSDPQVISYLQRLLRGN